jgi:hypothetical protein
MTVRSVFVLLSLACSFVAAPTVGARVEGAGATCANSARMLQTHAAQTSFDDFIEDTTGPDICAANAVSNDNSGTITFGLHIHNRAGYIAGESYGVFLDTDSNRATGGQGAEYLARLDASAVELLKWNGSAFVTQSSSPAANWVAGFGPVFALKAAELGGVTRFAFFLSATDGVNADVAPDAGSWSYELTRLTLTAGRLWLMPPRAGRGWQVGLPVTRSDQNGPLREGAITCSAKIGAVRVNGRGSFLGPYAVCSWQLQKSARNKRITGTVAVTFQNLTAKKSFAFTVR